MADLQNALALSEPKERPLKMAQRNDQGNGKKPFWSSKVHGIPQGYNTNRPSTVPPHPQQTGALATRPKSANQAALDRRDGRLVERDKESAASLVPLEVLAQIENSLKTAVVQCCPEYEKKQTILLRAFQTFDQAGRGTIPLDAFRKALACFQIETSEAEGRALFTKYGQTLKGQMPYEVFILALFASENRMLSWTGVQRGPWEATTVEGKRREEQAFGKIQPRRSGPGHSATGIYPPSNWNPALLRRSRRPPEQQLELQHVYGYSGRTKYDAVSREVDPLNSGMSPSLFFTATGEVAYYTAGVAVVHDFSAGKAPRNRQRFFQSHDDDILCMTIDPSRNYCATGQVAPLKRAQGGPCKPTVSVWDVHNMCELVQLEHEPVKDDNGVEQSMAGVQGVAFSKTGELVVTVCRDTKAHVHVWRWRRGELLCRFSGKQGLPPVVYGISWNHRSDQEMAKGNVDFATYGVKHICFWRRKDPGQFKLTGKKPTAATRGQPQNDPAWEPCNGQFGDGSLKADGSAKVGDPQNVLCCEFYEAEPGFPETTMSRMRCVTGTGDGNVLLWRNMSTGDDCMMQVIKKLMYQPVAKIKTTKMLPAHTKNCSAVRVRIKRDKKSNSLVTDIISGGSGGLLQVWRQEGKDVFKRRSEECLEIPPESKTASLPRIKAIDFFPGTGEFIVGTDESDIWQINPKDPKDPTGPKDLVLMVKGHKEKVDALAAHPKQAGLFATGSHGDHVYLWDAQKKQLLAKKALKGYEITSVCFNPAGDRLAVGTVTGRVFILVLDNDNPDPKTKSPLYRLRLTGRPETAMPAISDSFQRIPMMSYSPDGRVLAVASADQCIYLYAAEDDKYGLGPEGEPLNPRRRVADNPPSGFRYLAKCSGHSSTVNHLDWSTDSRVLQSNDQSYELLYWQADRLSPGLGMQLLHDQRDTQWETWSTINGFDVMGMFPKGTDNTDINKTARSNHTEGERFVAAATDFGALLLFNYPAVVEGGPFYINAGHSSHVSNVKWLIPCKDLSKADPDPAKNKGTPRDQELLISAGGADRSIFQWRLVPKPGHAIQPAAAAAAAPAAAPLQLQHQSGAGAEATRSPSFLLQQERLHEQEAKLSTQEEQIALLKARLDALELAPTADRPQVI